MVTNNWQANLGRADLYNHKERGVQSLEKGKIPFVSAGTAFKWLSHLQTFSSECSPVKTARESSPSRGSAFLRLVPRAAVECGAWSPGLRRGVPTCVHASLGDVSAGSKLSTRLGSQACSSLEAFVCLQVNVATFPTWWSSSRVIGVPVLQDPSENGWA